MTDLARILLSTLGIYLAVGLAFALAFAARGAGAIDPVASRTSVAFRLLIMPGAAALWPVLALAWARAARGPAPVHDGPPESPAKEPRP